MDLETLTPAFLDLAIVRGAMVGFALAAPDLAARIAVGTVASELAARPRGIAHGAF